MLSETTKRQLRAEAYAAAHETGTATDRHTFAAERLSNAQRRHLAGRNFMAPEGIAYRILRGGGLLVEIAGGEFLDSYLLGVSVYCIGDLAPHATAWDSELSRCCHSAGELRDYLAELDTATAGALATIASKTAAPIAA